MNKTLKIILTFTGLKLLEIAFVCSIPTIFMYIIYCLMDWNWGWISSISVCKILGKLFYYTVISVVYGMVGIVTIMGLYTWFTRNFDWAKEIVEEREQLKKYKKYYETSSK